MNGKGIFSLAAATLLGGGLFAGSIGWAAADHPMSGRGDRDEQSSGMMADSASHETPEGMMGDMMSHMMSAMMGEMMGDMMGHMMGGMMDESMPHRGWQTSDGTMDDEHTQMQATIAEALGLTVEELQAEHEAGKCVAQIAEEQGVDLTDFHEEVMGEFGMHSR